MGDLSLFLLPSLFLVARLIFLAGRRHLIVMIFLSTAIGLIFLAASTGQGEHCVGGSAPWWYPNIAGDSPDREMPCPAVLLAPLGVEKAVYGFAGVRVGEAVRVMSLAGMPVESLRDMYRSLERIPRGAIVKGAFAYADSRATIPYYKTESSSDFVGRFSLQPCTWHLLNPQNLMLNSISGVDDAGACSFLVFQRRPRSLRMHAVSGVSEWVSANGYRGHVVMGFVYGIRRGAGWGRDLTRGVFGALWRMSGGGRPWKVSWQLFSSQWNKPWYLLPLKKFWDPFFLLYKLGCLLMALSVTMALSFSLSHLVGSRSMAGFRIQAISALILAFFMVLNDTWFAVAI